MTYEQVANVGLFSCLFFVAGFTGVVVYQIAKGNYEKEEEMQDEFEGSVEMFERVLNYTMPTYEELVSKVSNPVAFDQRELNFKLAALEYMKKELRVKSD